MELRGGKRESASEQATERGELIRRPRRTGREPSDGGGDVEWPERKEKKRERRNAERAEKAMLGVKGEKEKAGREETASGPIEKSSEERERRNGERANKEMLGGKRADK